MTTTTMIKDRISELVVEALHAAQEQNLLPQIEIPDPNVERPQNEEHGDYSSSLPLKMARAARMDPARIAQILTGILIARLPQIPEISAVQVAHPGFINFTLDAAWLRGRVDEIIAQGDRYGHSDAGQGASVQVEFVSVNPTGPVHVGHGRGAVLGSTLSSLLAAVGYSVQREYYINDAGNQMDNFYRSVWARYLQALGRDEPMPEEGYQGGYLVDLAQAVASEHGDSFLLQGEETGV
ncbi:MAG: arginine--tRNA ligase, partial [Chloroflexi bacterium]|nr:arginine--tRNA ligase [Chloroflexota bacterium]